jgi:pyochelin biosynthesis protein PchC
MRIFSSPQRAWIRRFGGQPNAAYRLVCLPHAGGAASFYWPWRRFVPDDIELVAVQYPGREDRLSEPPITRMDTLVDGIVEALESDSERPTALFGHSMGAAVAFEIANRWQQQRAPLLHLFASGHPAPYLRRPGTTQLLNQTMLVEELRRLGGTREELLSSPDFLRMVLPATQADYQLIESYETPHACTLHAPVTALFATDDPEVDLTEAAAWAEVTDGTFLLQKYTGGHFYLSKQTESVATGVVTSIVTGAP